MRGTPPSSYSVESYVIDYSLKIKVPIEKLEVRLEKLAVQVVRIKF